MRQLLMILICTLTITSCNSKKNNSEKTIPEPKRVLDSILIVAKNNSLYKENVDWDVLEKEVYTRFIDSDTITSIIKPVQHLLNQLGDFHGSLFLNGQHYRGNVKVTRDVSYDYQSKDYISKMSSIFQKTLNQDTIKGFITTEKIAYLEIPMMMPYGGDGNDVIANTLKIRNKICELKSKNPIGWILDLRGNLGGNMYPMLMGLAEILPLKINMGGDSKDGKSINQKWKMENGIFYYGENSYPNIPKLNCQFLEQKNKIAVLIGRYTASSGEVVACALKTQEKIQLFGEQTSGATTANQWTPIGKEVVFNPAISYYVSKNKMIHKDGVIPDIEISEDFSFDNPISGKVFKKAVQWLTKK